MKYWAIIIFSLLLSGCATPKTQVSLKENKSKRACLCYRDERTGRVLRDRVLVLSVDGDTATYILFDNRRYKELDGERFELTYREHKDKVYLVGTLQCPSEVWELTPQIPQAIYDLERRTNGP